MWDKEDPKSKWLHLAVKLVAALVIFKLGVLVGEFKVIKAMVLRGGDHPKMLFKGEGREGMRVFDKRAMPMMGGDVLYWRGDASQPGAAAQEEPVPEAPAQP